MYHSFFISKISSHNLLDYPEKQLIQKRQNKCLILYFYLLIFGIENCFLPILRRWPTNLFLEHYRQPMDIITLDRAPYAAAHLFIYLMLTILPSS